jgi:hypothetical protein
MSKTETTTLKGVELIGKYTYKSQKNSRAELQTPPGQTNIIHLEGQKLFDPFRVVGN